MGIRNRVYPVKAGFSRFKRVAEMAALFSLEFSLKPERLPGRCRRDAGATKEFALRRRSFNLS